MPQPTSLKRLVQRPFRANLSCNYRKIFLFFVYVHRIYRTLRNRFVNGEVAVDDKDDKNKEKKKKRKKQNETKQFQSVKATRSRDL